MARPKIPFYQFVILIISIILLGYVFYGFFRKVEWGWGSLWRPRFVEGMSEAEPFYKEVMNEIKYKELDAKELPSGISDMPKKSQDMPLVQYCIKGSANSAYSGDHISDEMVKYVLSRGCRFLDFEVYHLPIGDSPEEADVFAPYVGYSSDPASVNSTTKNNYPFRKVLKTTLANAFVRQSGDKYECPNPKDPLFIHIRIKTDSKTKDKLYDMIQKDIDSVFNLGYSEYFLIKKTVLAKNNSLKTNKTNNVSESIPVSGRTPIQRLSQKVVFVFDYEPENYIGTYHNLTSDTSELMRITYDEMNTFRYAAMPPKRLDSKRTTADKMRMAVPDSNRSDQPNPNIHSAIKNYGVQTTLMQYYIADKYLIRAESMYQQYGAAILPMALLLNFIQTHGEDDKSSDIISPKIFV